MLIRYLVPGLAAGLAALAASPDPKSRDIAQIDPALAASQASAAEAVWHDVSIWGLEGREWTTQRRLRYFDRFPAEARFHDDNHAALREAFAALKKEGMTGLYYLPGDTLFGSDGDGSVDGSHPSDLGFMRQADAMEPVLREALGLGPAKTGPGCPIPKASAVAPVRAD